MDLGRALHVQGFVKSFVIEDFDEVIEAPNVLRLRAVIIIFQSSLSDSPLLVVFLRSHSRETDP
jgi:hypothetical protein